MSQHMRNILMGDVPEKLCSELESAMAGDKSDIHPWFDRIMEKITRILIKGDVVLNTKNGMQRNPVYMLLRHKKSTMATAEKVKGGEFFKRLQEFAAETKDDCAIPLANITWSHELLIKYKSPQQGNSRMSTLLTTLVRHSRDPTQQLRHTDREVRCDYMQFFLYCMCFSMMGDALQPDSNIRSFQKVLDDYLFYFFPVLAKKKTTMVGMTAAKGMAALVRVTGSSPKKKKEPSKDELRRKAHGSTFIALIAELWMSKFVTDTLHVRGGGRRVVSKEPAAPPEKLLLCALDVVYHLCQDPFEMKKGSKEKQLKEHVKTLQQPLFLLLRQCFEKKSFTSDRQIALVMDIWCCILSQGKCQMSAVGEKEQGPYQAPYPTVKKTGPLQNKKAVTIKFDETAKLWVRENFAFYYVLPLHFVEMAARNLINAAESTVEKTVVRVLTVYRMYEDKSRVNHLLNYIQSHAKDPKPKVKKALEEHFQQLEFPKPGGKWDSGEWEAEVVERYFRDELSKDMDGQPKPMKKHWTDSFHKLKAALREEEGNISLLKDILDLDIQGGDRRDASVGGSDSKPELLIWDALLAPPWQQPVPTELMAVVFDEDDDYGGDYERETSSTTRFFREMSRQLYQRLWFVLGLLALFVPGAHMLHTYFEGSTTLTLLICFGAFPAVYRWISAERNYEIEQMRDSYAPPPRFWLDFSFLLQNDGGMSSPLAALVFTLFWVGVLSFFIDASVQAWDELAVGGLYVGCVLLSVSPVMSGGMSLGSRKKSSARGRSTARSRGLYS